MDRRSLSASLRGGRHPVSGEAGIRTDDPVDLLSAGETITCAPTTLRLAEDLFKRWNEALRSGNAQRVSQCYTEDAVLLPTHSNVPRLFPQRDSGLFRALFYRKSRLVRSINAM